MNTSATIKPTVTAISDFASSLGLYSSLASTPGSSQETVVLESGAEALVLRGVPVFRSGSFADSMGEENTWTDLHIQEMVSHFEMLSGSGHFDRVPVRCDHFSIFSGGLSNVIGYHDNLRMERRTSSVDGQDYAYLVADMVILREDAKANITSGLWSKRSAEIGTYRTNSGDAYWPTLIGTAFVDIPAVEGLTFSRQSDDNRRTLVIEEFSMTDTTGNGGQAAKDTQSPAHKFRVAGKDTSDFSAVQNHITSLEAEVESLRKHQADAVRAERENFVASLVEDQKILANQQDMFSKIAAGMTADDFAEFKSSYEDAGAHKLLGSYGDAAHHQAPSGGPAPSDPQGEDADEVYASQVRMHAAIGTPTEEIEKFACFKSLAAKHDGITVNDVVNGTFGGK